ncbi:hypothetical protein PSU4_40010 [Pseudonocardia sulfidoxydans NBRC 16205]|uniref:Uncharacterized protein n=3 Tax=Pseudonocardia sulfidoxydans TaxID=54011 RepID=A0A511DKW5_9PSEU|nr:hypothetical protein PSU4_40010 [Pseudonocardia sulfidoxydans NBRC 16205]
MVVPPGGGGPDGPLAGTASLTVKGAALRSASLRDRPSVCPWTVSLDGRAGAPYGGGEHSAPPPQGDRATRPGSLRCREAAMTTTNTPDTTTGRAAGGARKGRRRADADGTLPADVPQTVEAPVGACAVMGVLVRVAGAVPIRLDMSHVGTHEMQLGLSLGTILIYLRTAITAHAIADGWANAALLARGLPMSAVGKRPMPVGPSTVGAMARMAGVPRVVTGWQDAVAGTTRPALLRIQAGPVTWEVCDTAAYRSMLRGWRQAAQMLDAGATLDTEDADGGE